MLPRRSSGSHHHNYTTIDPKSSPNAPNFAPHSCHASCVPYRSFTPPFTPSFIVRGAHEPPPALPKSLSTCAHSASFRPRPYRSHDVCMYVLERLLTATRHRTRPPLGNTHHKNRQALAHLKRFAPHCSGPTSACGPSCLLRSRGSTLRGNVCEAVHTTRM